MKNFSRLLCIPLVLFLVSSMCTKRQNLPPIDIPVDSTKWTLKEVNPQILIGSPIEVSFNDEKYFNTIKTELSTGEGLWYARWDGWPMQDSFDFTELNKNVNWMKQNGLIPTVHMLVGPDTYMPDWLIQGNWEKPRLDSLLKNMIYSIMDVNDNKNKVDTWNVINELFDDDGTYRTNMVWNKLGWEQDSSKLSGLEKINTKHPVFIRKAFTYCREKTKAKLELRDFNIENDIPNHDNYKKQKAIYQLLKHMLNSNIPVDAVGIQGHITVGDTGWRLQNKGLKGTVEKFKNLGIEVYITEIDADIGNQAWTNEVAQKQKEDFYNYIKQALEGGVKRISFWGVQDGMDKGWLTDKHPLLWDEKFNKKPAYYGTRQALLETK